MSASLLKFADDMLEGRDAIQRDLDRLERWACVNLIKFKKAKCHSCICARAILSTNTVWAENVLKV